MTVTTFLSPVPYLYWAFFCLCFVLVWRYLTPSPFRHIPGPPTASWFSGNLMQLFNPKGLSFHHGIVKNYGNVVKVHGFFGDEQLYISDPTALQCVLRKDEHGFEETPVFIEWNKIIFGEGLVATVGEQHRRQRRTVNPLFSVSNLRKLTPVFWEVADKLADVLFKEVPNHEMTEQVNGESTFPAIDMSSWMSRVALESVGQAILGYSFDSLDSPSTNSYTRAIRELIPTLFRLSLVRQLAPFLVKLGPPWFRRKLVEYMPFEVVQKLKMMSDEMYNAALDIYQSKKSSPETEQSDIGFESRKDLLDMLISENAAAVQGDRLTEAEIVGQITVLIFGAQDTTSSALSRILYQLAIHPEIQEEVRKEVQALPTSNKDWESYTLIASLKWLDAVIKESLRLYPPVPFVRRTAVQTRTLPLSKPMNGHHSEEYNSIIIPEGTTLFLGLAAANRSTEIWGEDAAEWKPKRWQSNTTGRNKDPLLRLPGIYAGTLSFLGGERACPGYNFAVMEMKIILSVLLSRFTFGLSSDKIVWNLSQIISPSFVPMDVENRPSSGEQRGLPLILRRVSEPSDEEKLVTSNVQPRAAIGVLCAMPGTYS